MGNKEDWEEVEKSVKDVEAKKIEEYRGLNYAEELQKKITKTINKTVKKFSKKILRPILIIAIIIIMFFIITIALAYFDGIISSHNINVKESIEKSQHIKIKQISADVNRKEYSGEYYFQIKKYPQITFKAIKHFGQEKNDLKEQLTKYLFKSWENPKKNEFKVIENQKDDGLLEFKVYIEIDSYEELLEKTKLILEFLNYAEKWNNDNGRIVYLWQQKEGQYVMPLYDVCLKKDDFIFFPYTGLFQTENQIIENAKQLYNNILLNKEN